MNTLISYRRIALLFLLVLGLTACGSFQLVLEDQAADQTDASQESPPVDVLVARETILNHLRARYGDEAPSSGLTWEAVLVAPEGLVGASSYRFDARGWTMTIAYPIVAPEATIYTIELFSSTTGFHWTGQVDAQGNVSEMGGAGQDIPVIAWPGKFKQLAEGAGPDDYFEIIPEGTGALGVKPLDKELESIITLNYAPDADYVHIWGILSCGVDDYNDCRILVDRVRQGLEITNPEIVDGWEGVIYSGPPEPRSGGDDYFALVGDYPVQYGLWSMDDNLRTEMEALRDTQTVIRVWGTIVAGIPDWNGTQIAVERFEIVDRPSGTLPPAPTWDEPDTGWLTYTNQRYGYRFQYPPAAEIEEIGVQGYPSDENGMPVGGLPDGVKIEDYFTYLEQTYGNNICVGIRYSLGYIYISAAENTEARYAICGRTGVGDFEIVQKEEQIQVAGMVMTASGMEVKGEGESLDMHNETMIVRMPDGTRIEYGAAPHHDATYEDFLMKTRPVLLQILETFEFIK